MDTRQEEIREGRTADYSRNSSPREIENDIRDTRQKMDETLDRLSGRLHPRHLLDDALDSFRSDETRKQAMEQAKRAGRKTVEMVKDNPLPALMIGAGAAWLAYSQGGQGQRQDRRTAYGYRFYPRYAYAYESPFASPFDEEYDRYYGSGTRPRAGQDWSMGGRMGELREKTREAVDEAKEKASGAGDTVKEKVGETTHEAREKLGRYGEKMREEAAGRARDYRHRTARAGHEFREKARHGYEHGTERVQETMHTHPLLVGAAALAAGLILGLAIPESGKEDRRLGKGADRLKEKARRAGEDLYAKGRNVAQATAHEAVEQARRQGLTSGGLKEQAGQTAGSAGQ